MVAHDDDEGTRLLQLRRDRATILAAENFSAPVVLLQGTDKASALRKMLEYTKHTIPENAEIRVIDNGGERTFLMSEYCKEILTQ